ncbi:dihydrodipicolinate synthase family protein [Affinibrenneria salicis]|uniref:Dihydrodipicolinate synthase family protein n=1 Tax=Affinibrenneria salicis TaxID=2590031 RepID=A0A5J5FRR7_9GAMM|nr:dihydrodipicolinate synthase family protein [Affinibrenneria salicis]KAA8995230.1 dihydrodipicolinate synthase family protein [Affinibrenneria salicis]
MNKDRQFSGIIPPVSTIFTDRGAFDEQGMATLIDFLIGAGVDGLFFLGTGGEFSQMSADERKQIAEFAVRHVNHRVPVLIGVGSTNSREAVQLSRHAAQIGADAVVAINPYYWQLTEKNLLGYYSDIAQSMALPVILYNFPALTGQDLHPALVKKLVGQHANIVGIKDTIDSVAHLREMIVTVKGEYPHFSVFCGYDDHLLNTLLLGGDGAISASANFAPQLSIEIYRAFIREDRASAAELHQTLLQLPLLYKIDSPFINVIKEACRLCGLNISTWSLPPSGPLNPQQKESIKEILNRAGLI